MEGQILQRLGETVDVKKSSYLSVTGKITKIDHIGSSILTN